MVFAFKGDSTAILPEYLGISKPKWEQLMAMLVKNGYIESVAIASILSAQAFKVTPPHIT